MNLSEEQLQTFMKIYREKYGVSLSHEDAYEAAFWIISLINKIYYEQ
jgi:hypothetical protein